jgi:hypothetical protein
MNMTTKAALAAVALAAGMFTSSAQATDYDLNSLVVDWTAGVDKAFTGAAGAFVDHYTFTTDGSGYLTDSLLQQLGISITSFSIHDAASNALIGPAGYEVSASDSSVAQAGSGYWYFSNVGVTANTAYYLEVAGSRAAGDTTYGFTVNLTPVPEPETYALLLAGLGVVGWVRRRKSA